MTNKHKTDWFYTEYLFRPVYEMQTAAVWFAGALATPLLSAASTQASLGVTFTLTAAMGVGGLYYTMKSIPLIRKQMRLQTNKKEFMDIKALRKLNQLEGRAKGTMKKDERRVLLGYGFEWGSEHANRAYQVINLDSTMSGVQPPFPFNYYIKSNEQETEDLGGKAWIHALGDEVKQLTYEDAYFGHTLVTGNIGTGKTTLLRLLSLNTLHLSVGKKGKVLIIIDPKNDGDWKHSIRKEMEYLGVGDKFYWLHPAKQSSGCRLALLKNYVRITEIADRIAPLMGTSGGSKTFEDFAFEQLTFVAQGIEYLGKPIRLTTIREAMNAGKFEFCDQVLRVYLERVMGPDWEDIIDLEKNSKKEDELPAFYMARYYKQNLRENHFEQAIEGITQFLEHPHEHFIKMITSLRPVLTALTTKPMDDLFSAVDDIHSDDKRTIIDIEHLMETGGCLYVSLDSMTDSKTAGFISRLIMAEIAAVSGRRYNDEDTDAQRVAVFLDEAHAALENNEALLNLLSQGRASGLELTLSTQTVSDLVAKTDEPTAKRVLGLCNNFITMRSTDPDTQEYITAQFGKTAVTQVQMSAMSTSSSANSMFNFSANRGERTQKTLEDAMPPQLIGDLPKLQFVARLSNGHKLKMRLPIIVNKSEKKEVAPWVS